MSSTLVSVVIPCFNNEVQVKETVSSILIELDGNRHDYSVEILLIDDCSGDGTWDRINELYHQYSEIRAFRLRNNVGAFRAILAGFELCKGDCVIVIAADGDDPVTFITNLLAEWDDEVDLVQANRSAENARKSSTTFGTLFYSILRLVGANNIPLGGSDFVLISRNLLDASLEEGWLEGNTLIQVFQKAKSVKAIPYIKNRSNASSWTLTKKINLFVKTILLFIFPGKRKSANAFYSIVERLDDR